MALSKNIRNDNKKKFADYQKQLKNIEELEPRKERKLMKKKLIKWL